MLSVTWEAEGTPFEPHNSRGFWKESVLAIVSELFQERVELKND